MTSGKSSEKMMLKVRLISSTEFTKISNWARKWERMTILRPVIEKKIEDLQENDGYETNCNQPFWPASSNANAVHIFRGRGERSQTPTKLSANGKPGSLKPFWDQPRPQSTKWSSLAYTQQQHRARSSVEACLFPLACYVSFYSQRRGATISKDNFLPDWRRKVMSRQKSLYLWDRWNYRPHLEELS